MSQALGQEVFRQTPPQTAPACSGFGAVELEEHRACTQPSAPAGSRGLCEQGRLPCSPGSAATQVRQRIPGKGCVCVSVVYVLCVYVRGVCAHTGCGVHDVREHSKQEVQTSRAGRAAVTEASTPPGPRAGAGVEPSLRERAGVPTRASPPVSTGCSLCPEGLCSLQLLHGRRPRHSSIRGTSNHGRGWFQLPGRRGGLGNGTGLHLCCPEGREELLRGLPGCSGPLSSPAERWLGCRPMGSQAVLEGQA